MSDPTPVVDALDEAIDAFDEMGHGRPTYEPGIDSETDWTTQLTKACRLLAAAEAFEGEYYVATVELCFGVIERSLEAFAIEEGGDDLRDFQEHPHEWCYDRAEHFGLFSRDVTEQLKDLYDHNRADSYYGGRRPTARQAASMQELASAIHVHVTDQIREGGVCVCDD